MMYTVLIVDDEPLVQVGLQSMVDWKELQVRLLPSASNGQVALDTIRKESPDLVFTDIRMPTMDGLELIRRCQAEVDPCPEFVVLTSFEDFGYAREAVKFHVVDYLVKLELTPDILIQTFLKARLRIDPKRTLKERSGPQDQGVRDRVFFSLLNRGLGSDQEAEKTLGDLGIDFAGRHRLAVTCRVGGDPDTYAYVLKMVKEILGREYRVQDLPYSQDQFILLLASEGEYRDEKTAETRFTASVTTALSMVQRYFNGTVEAGVGRSVPHLLGLADSYRDSLKALEACTPAQTVVVYRDQGAEARPELSGEAFRRNLEKALETQDVDALKACFGAARSAIEDHGRLTEALDLGTAAVYGVLSAVPDAEAWLATVFSDRPEGHKVLYAVPSTGHVLRWLADLEAALGAHLGEKGAKHQEKLVDSMRLYIEQHHRERLQLKAVAEHFRLSPNYAGTLFRQFTGKGFSEYVSEVKVTKAQELLASRKYRIYEVSDLLGFENSYYFSKVFRRVTGHSPREYLAQLGIPPSD